MFSCGIIFRLRNIARSYNQRGIEPVESFVRSKAPSPDMFYGEEISRDTVMEPDPEIKYHFQSLFIGDC